MRSLPNCSGAGRSRLADLGNEVRANIQTIVERFKMKLFKSLIVALCACALLAGTVRAEDKKEEKKTCCQKAAAEGKACRKKCCIAAHKANKSCEKCNPNKEDLKKDSKKDAENKDK
jgi:hypothetical protein